MSYENPVYMSHSYNAADFGAGDITKKIAAPRGAVRGKVEGITAYATEVFNQVTTQGRINIGVTGDLDKFASVPLGALASGASQGLTKAQLTDDGYFDLSQEAVDDLTVTLLAPTGGTPSGIADVVVTIAWFY